MAARPAVVTGLVDAAARRRLAVEGQVAGRVTAALRGFTGWYSPPEVDALSSRVAQLVVAGQRTVAGLTDAYLARVLVEMTGRDVRPRGTAPGYAQLRAGQEPAVVYGRAAADYRQRVASQAEPGAALAAVVARADAMARMDLALAHRWAARETLASTPGVDGYRRVIRPEASAGGSCGLCAAASDRTYHVEDLMPLHERCACTVMPIVGDDDPGRSLNNDELSSLYSAAGSTSGRDLKRVRVSVHEHGELGPVLRVKGQDFRGPNDIP